MAKHLVQLVIAGTQVLGRALTKAFREEIRLSQEAAKRRGHANATASAADSLKLGMSVEEALQILNVEDARDAEKLQKNFEHLFEVNDKSNGGSFYLQSKVVRAKERLDQEIRLSQQVQGEKGQQNEQNEKG